MYDSSSFAYLGFYIKAFSYLDFTGIVCILLLLLGSQGGSDKEEMGDG